METEVETIYFFIYAFHCHSLGHSNEIKLLSLFIHFDPKVIGITQFPCYSEKDAINHYVLSHEILNALNRTEIYNESY